MMSFKMWQTAPLKIESGEKLLWPLCTTRSADCWGGRGLFLLIRLSQRTTAAPSWYRPTTHRGGSYRKYVHSKHTALFSCCEKAPAGYVPSDNTFCLRTKQYKQQTGEESYSLHTKRPLKCNEQANISELRLFKHSLLKSDLSSFK